MDITKYMADLSRVLEEEANKKIAYAMNLFRIADDDLKSVALYASGFSGVPTEEKLREHFDTLDLLDQLDGFGGFIDNLESNMELDGLVPEQVPGHPKYVAPDVTH